MSQQIQITGGAKVRSLEGVITGTSGVLSSVPLGAANGVATLDSGGKVPVSQLPSSVVTYLGTWNAATNTPTLVNGTGDAGDMYICNVQGTVNFGAGPVTFAVGDWVLYGSGTWQKSSGQNGTVTSVAASITGNAVGLTGSPITTAGTLAFAFAGTNLQYVNGAGNLTTFPTLITSIGLSMPSAFSVANSPLTANGTIAVTGAGTTAQYIRGDGSLATFPTIATEAQRLITEVYNETGATLTKGTVVYINGGHGNLPTITKAIATGDATSAQTYGIVQTDITDNNNGYVVVIGSLGDLDTQAYANGTQLYLSSTTAGAWTSTKQYAPAHLVYVAIVTRSHPTQGVVEVRIQNGFEMDELHNVSAQSPLNNQGLFYNTSTSLWENKSIATALGYTPANDANVVHLTGNETIGGTKTFSDATKNNGGIFLQNASSGSLAGYMNIGGLTNGVKFTSGGGISNTFTLPSATGYTFTFPNATGTIALTSDLAAYVPITRTLTGLGSISVSGSGDLSANRTISIAQSSVSSDGYLSATNFNTFNNKQNALTLTTTGTSGAATLVGATLNIPQYTDAYTGTVTSVSALTIGTSGTDLSSTVANSTTTPVITLNVPTASATNRGALSSADWTTFNSKQGTITLTTTGTSGAATFTSNTLNIPNYGSALSGYLPLTGGTLTGALGGTSAVFSGSVGVGATTSGSDFRYYPVSSASGNSVLVLKDDGADGTLDICSEIIGNANAASSPITFRVSSVVGGRFEAMRITNTGNLGLGVTPSAWNGIYKVAEIGTAAIFGTSSYNSAAFSTNVFYNASNSPRYIASDFSNMYWQDDGQHLWYNAPSGTAGAAITFTQAMTLTAAGRLLLGTTTESTYLLDVNGTGRFSGDVSVIKSSPNINLNATSGTSAQYNINNSSGTLHWAMYSTIGGAGVQANWQLYSAGKTGGAGNIIDITPTGAASFSSSIASSISGSGDNAFLLATGTGTGARYSYIANDGAAAIFGIEKAAGGAILGGSSAYATVLYSNNATPLQLGTNQLVRMTITSSGNVGIGTSSPVSFFSIGTYGSAGKYIDSSTLPATPSNYLITLAPPSTTGYYGGGIGWSEGSNTAAGINAYDDGAGGALGLSFATGTNSGLTERMRITSGGNVLIGTTDDGGRLVSYSTTAATQIKAAGTAPAITFSNTVLSPTIGGVLGVATAANQFFTGTASSDMVLANQFSAGALIFGTSNVERMRIIAGGSLLVGTTSSTGLTTGSSVNVGISLGGGVISSQVNNNSNQYWSKATGYTSGDYTAHFVNGTYVGGISTNGSTTTYAVASDYRLKEDFKDYNGLDLVSKIKTYDYKYKSDKSRSYGVIAHELQSIISYAVTGVKDGKKMQGVDYSKIVPVLIKAIQELKLEIETLKNK